MSTTPSPTTTQQSQTSDSVACTPSSSSIITTPASSPFSSIPTIVDVTYQIVGIKPTNRDWLIPSPFDLVRITGPLPRGNSAKANDGGIVDAGEGEEDDGFVIPCAAHLTWGDRSIHVTCSYYPSASLFLNSEECAYETLGLVDKPDDVKSVGVTMQEAIFPKEESQGEMGEDGDMRDDNGNAFMILHVNKGLNGSARLYCKKVTNSQNGLSDGVGESSGLDKSAEEIGGKIDIVGRRD